MDSVRVSAGDKKCKHCLFVFLVLQNVLNIFVFVDSVAIVNINVTVSTLVTLHL